MVAMLRAGKVRWQIASPTYSYERKTNLRAWEKRQWQREAATAAARTRRPTVTRAG